MLDRETAGSDTVVMAPSRYRRPARANAKLPAETGGIAALAEPPDPLVLVPIVVVRVEQILRPAVKLDVLFRHEVDRRHLAARLLSSEGAVQLIHTLPAVHVEWLGDGCGLVLASPNPLISRNAAVARGDELRRAARWNSSRAEGWHAEVEVEIVDAENPVQIAAEPL